MLKLLHLHIYRRNNMNCKDNIFMTSIYYLVQNTAKSAARVLELAEIEL